MERTRANYSCCKLLELGVEGSLSFSLPWDLDCCKESRNELCFARLAGFVFCVAQGMCALMRVCVCVCKEGREGGL